MASNSNYFDQYISRLRSNDPSLTSFDLRFNNINEVRATRLSEALAVNSTLTSLRLSTINEVGATRLSEALAVNSTLTSLYLDDNSLSSSSAKNSILGKVFLNRLERIHLPRLFNNDPSLTSLDLWYNNINEVGATRLSEALAVNSTLTSLRLSNNNINEVGATRLSEALAVNSNLTSLHLDSILFISSSAKNSILEKVSLNRLERIHLHRLFNNDPSLTSLDLSKNTINELGVTRLSEALAVNSTLTSLRLSNNNINEVGATRLSEALAVNSTLTALDFDDGNSHISPSAQNSILGKVSLNRLERIHLPRLFNNDPSLTSLDLWYNNINEVGATRLSEALAVNSTLTSLNLSSNNLNDSSLTILVQALLTRIASPKLILDLTSNKLTVLPRRLANVECIHSISFSRNFQLHTPPYDQVVRCKSFTELRRLILLEQGPTNRARLLLLGEGDVGKTTLATALVHNRPRIINWFSPKPPESLEEVARVAGNQSTHLLNISQWSYTFEKLENELTKSIKVSILDFGGQPGYYATGQLFLAPCDATYILVFNSSHSSNACQNIVEKWLTFISLRIADEHRSSQRLSVIRPSVLIIGNHLGEIDPRQRENHLLSLQRWYQDSKFRQKFSRFIQLTPKLFFIDYSKPDEAENGIVSLRQSVAEVCWRQISNFPHRLLFANKLLNKIDMNKTSTPLLLPLFLRCEDEFRDLVVSCFTSQEKKDLALIEGLESLTFFASYLQNLGECIYLPTVNLVCFQMNTFFTLLAQVSNKSQIINTSDSSDKARHQHKSFLKNDRGIVARSVINEICELETKKPSSSVTIDPDQFISILSNLHLMVELPPSQGEPCYFAPILIDQQVGDGINRKFVPSVNVGDQQFLYCFQWEFPSPLSLPTPYPSSRMPLPSSSSLDDPSSSSSIFSPSFPPSSSGMPLPSSSRMPSPSSSFLDNQSVPSSSLLSSSSSLVKPVELYAPISLLYHLQLDFFQAKRESINHFHLTYFSDAIHFTEADLIEGLIEFKGGSDGILRLRLKDLLSPLNRMAENLSRFLHRFDSIIEIISKRINPSVLHGLRLGIICPHCASRPLRPHLNSYPLDAFINTEWCQILHENQTYSVPLSTSALHRVQRISRSQAYPLSSIQTCGEFRKLVRSSSPSDIPFEFVYDPSTSSTDSWEPVRLFCAASQSLQIQIFRDGSSQHSSAAPQRPDDREKLSNMAMEFNKMALAPKTGVSAQDPVLWAFSAQIQASQDTIHALQAEFEGFKHTFVGIIHHHIKSCFKEGEGWVDQPQFNQGGSVENQTHLTRPDLDMILVLNPTTPLSYRKKDENTELYRSQTSTSGEFVLYPALCVTLAKACDAAIDEYLTMQSILPNNTVSLSYYKPDDSLLVYTFRSANKHFDGNQLEFDLVPAIQTTSGVFFLINPLDGTVTPSATVLASQKIATYAKHFLGLRHMMQVLKLVLKTGCKRFPGQLDMPSCAFEMAILLLVEDRSKYDPAEWWRKSTFTEVFRAAITLVLDRLASGIPLPAPNDPRDDLLRNVRKAPDIFRSYFIEWLKVEEKDMLSELTACFDFLNLEREVYHGALLVPNVRTS